jgi:uroporphyrinogen-III decarboxylase
LIKKDEKLMTGRERMLAALRCESVDRLPFWPKLFPEYLAYSKEEAFKDWSLQDYHDYFGSDFHEYVYPPVELDKTGVSINRVTTNETKEGAEETIEYLFTDGRYSEAEIRSTLTRDTHPVDYALISREDILYMTEWYVGTKYKASEKYLTHQKYQASILGQKGILAMPMGRSPFMQTLELLGGIEETQYLLADYPEEMEALFDALHGDMVRRIPVILEHTKADLMYMVEDTSTTIMSPEQFRKYCKPYLMEYNEICRARGKIMGLHMCGHLHALLGDLADMDIAVFEAFTTPDMGNTHLIDGKTHCPDTCLIGGTNATLWTKSAEEICAEIKVELDALDNHRGVIITTAGIIPIGCRPETVRTVCEYVKAFPVRME